MTNNHLMQLLRQSVVDLPEKTQSDKGLMTNNHLMQFSSESVVDLHVQKNRV